MEIRQNNRFLFSIMPSQSTINKKKIVQNGVKNLVETVVFKKIEFCHGL
jgi:hypothetical protein